MVKRSKKQKSRPKPLDVVFSVAFFYAGKKMMGERPPLHRGRRTCMIYTDVGREESGTAAVGSSSAVPADV